MHKQSMEVMSRGEAGPFLGVWMTFLSFFLGGREGGRGWNGGKWNGRDMVNFIGCVADLLSAIRRGEGGHDVM